MLVDVILILAAVMALAPYVVGPIAVRMAQRWPARPEFEPYDPIRHPLPDDLASAFRQSVDALVRDGSEVLADLAHESAVSSVQLRVGLLSDAGATTCVLVVGGRSTKPKAKLAGCYVEFPTKFTDGATLSVSNNSEPDIYPPVAGRLVERFPQVRDPVRVRRINEALLARDFATRGRQPLDPDVDPAAFVRAAMVREYDQQVGTGYLWLDTAAGVYRPTWRGAWLITWKLLPPMRQIMGWRRRRRAAALLTRLGLAGRDDRPVPAPASVDPMRWSFVMLGVVLALYLFGRLSTPSRERFALPRDFSVPADFAGAVRALEQLTDAAAVPLTGSDARGEQIPTSGVTVGIPGTRGRADALVAAAREPFLARGFLLFVAERHYGGEPDRVALFPSPDPFAVMRIVGTNGANYGIATDSVIRWLRALARDHPFIVTGIGDDWVEGRFTGELADPAALAQRFYAFCPDIVVQGTGSVSALARELGRERTLYCWWD